MASMREPTFLILTAIAAEPRHGYGIIQDVEQLSGGRVTLAPGTLYAALDRLADEGLIEADREETVNGRLRRYYRLSAAGAAALDAEIREMSARVAAASARLATRRAGVVKAAVATA